VKVGARREPASVHSPATGMLGCVSETSGDRLYAGVTAAERRSARRERLLGAVLDLVGETGVESLSVGAVCERASVSKRHFYESVAGLDELAGEALTEVLVGVAHRIAGADAGPTGDDRDEMLLETAVRAILDAFDDPRVARLYLQAPGNPGLRAARDQAVAGFVTQLLTLITGNTEHAPTARLMAHVVVGGVTDVVTLWLRGDLELDREEVVRSLLALGLDAVRHIRTAEPPSSSPSPRSGAGA
jgi:AcrR family transcriptional regulator